MNFAGCCDVGAGGVDVVMRWLAWRGRVFQNRMVRTDKGRIAVQLQRTVGDIIFNPQPTIVMSIEVKTERNPYDNLFLETWSNASPQREREGWLFTLDADFLFYYFIARDDLCVVEFQRLRRWAFMAPRADGSYGRVFDFPEKPQRAHRQLNATRGRPVPIAVLEREVGLVHHSPLADLSNPKSER